MILNQAQKFNRPNMKSELNKTTAFMLPAVDIHSDKASYKMLEQFGFVNCYLDHVQSLYRNENYIYLLFNPTTQGLFNFYRLYEVYRQMPNYVADYMVDDHLIMVVFKVKEKWKTTYQMFKQSRYSSMSKEYADLFKTITHSGKVNVGYQYLIIHKHKEYRLHLEKELDVVIDPSAELMDALDLTKEIFDYEPTKIQPGEGQCEIGETSPGESVHV